MKKHPVTAFHSNTNVYTSNPNLPAVASRSSDVARCEFRLFVGIGLLASFFGMALGIFIGMVGLLLVDSGAPDSVAETVALVSSVIGGAVGFMIPVAGLYLPAAIYPAKAHESSTQAAAHAEYMSMDPTRRQFFEATYDAIMSTPPGSSHEREAIDRWSKLKKMYREMDAKIERDAVESSVRYLLDSADADIKLLEQIKKENEAS